jgi:peptide/nickel transport system permease protein
MLPGSAIDAIIGRLGEQGSVGIESAKQFVEKFGLDKDLGTQYVNYMVNLFRGDLGPSLAYYPRSVSAIILDRMPWTIGLLGVSVLISWTLGNIFGALVAWRREDKFSNAIMVVNMCLSQIPYYLFAILLIYSFAYTIRIFPLDSGYNPLLAVRGMTWAFIVDVIWHAVLPALSIVLVSISGWLLNMRALVTSILGSDYFLFAEAKGLKRNHIIMKYAFRNALLPQLTGLGMSLGLIMSGALITEQVFAYPGIGSVLMDAINMRDYNLLQGIFLFTMLSVLTANLVIDLVSPLIDPQIRHERGE